MLRRWPPRGGGKLTPATGDAERVRVVGALADLLECDQPPTRTALEVGILVHGVPRECGHGDLEDSAPRGR